MCTLSSLLQLVLCLYPSLLYNFHLSVPSIPRLIIYFLTLSLLLPPLPFSLCDRVSQACAGQISADACN